MNRFQSLEGRSRHLKSNWRAARKTILEGKVNKEYVRAFQCVTDGADIDPRLHLYDWLRDLNHVYERRHLPEEMRRIADIWGVPVSQVMLRALLPIDNFMSEL